MSAEELASVEDAAHAARLSVASYARLALVLLAERGAIAAEEVKAEADRRAAGEEPPPTKKGRKK